MARGYSPAKERPRSASPDKFSNRQPKLAQKSSGSPVYYPEPNSFRQQMNGIVPGYTGHKPGDIFKAGHTVFGNLPDGIPTAMSPQGHKSLSGGVAGGLHPFEGMRPHPQHLFVTRPASSIMMTDHIEGYTGHAPTRGPWEKGLVVKVTGNPLRSKPPGWTT